MQKNKVETELRRIFHNINKKLFNSELVFPTLVFEPQLKCSLRYLAENKKLAIGQKFGRLQHEEFLVCLLHEMVHLANHQQKLVDCTRNQYHNKQFLAMALEIGLFVVRHKTQGWGTVSLSCPKKIDKSQLRAPSVAAIKARTEALKNCVFDKDLFAQIQEEINQREPCKNFFLKYVCKCKPPHNSIRSGRRPDGPNALNIRCMDCSSMFVCERE